MKGNEVIAHAAIRYGCDGYFGYPITPQSEVMETLMEEKPWETTGMVVLQAESEVSSINMVYGGASTGKRVMTSSSSPGVSLMSEGLSYLAGAELPCVVVNCQRGGPGLGTIQPSQGDYFQACKGGAHGDFHLIVLAPNSVQEMHDFVGLAFDLAFKYRNPAMILADGAIGQMMEKVVLAPQRPRKTDAEIAEECKDWATCGKGARKDRNIITSLELKSEVMEKINQRLQAKYKAMEEVMTSSSSPGVSLMSEGLSYLAGAELPCVVVNCQRGGPGLGTIQPSQGDYFQACKGGAHGDFHLIVLAPNSVQEMHDFVGLAFDLAFKYRNPAMILADGAIGQMMEKVVLAPQRPRKTDAEIAEECKDWATCGKGARKDRNIITSLELKSEVMEKINQRLQAKYKAMEENEVRYEAIDCDDADYVIVAFGSSARICSATVEMARAEGIKVGLLRPITLYPFPTKAIADLAKRGVKGFLSAELNAGQMVQDVKLAVNGAAPVEHYGRQGGMMFSPDEVLVALKEKLINKK